MYYLYEEETKGGMHISDSGHTVFAETKMSVGVNDHAKD